MRANHLPKEMFPLATWPERMINCIVTRPSTAVWKTARVELRLEFNLISICLVANGVYMCENLQFDLHLGWSEIPNLYFGVRFLSERTGSAQNLPVDVFVGLLFEAFSKYTLWKSIQSGETFLLLFAVVAPHSIKHKLSSASEKSMLRHLKRKTENTFNSAASGLNLCSFLLDLFCFISFNWIIFVFFNTVYG